MPDHLGPQELLRYPVFLWPVFRAEVGGGNFSRPRAYIKRWQELSDTLSLHRNSFTHLPPIPSSLQQGGTHLVPSLTTTPI